MARYQKSPNGIVLVLKPEAAAERLRAKLADQLKVEVKYIPSNNELGQMDAAIKAGLPVALAGPPGIGKTTLVQTLAKSKSLPLTTIMGDPRAKRYELIGSVMDLQDGSMLFNDGPISMAARAKTNSVLYVDEAFDLPNDVYVALTSMLDNRGKLFIRETDEDLSTNQVQKILTFNPPTIDHLDKLPHERTLDRIVMIRFNEHTGDQMVDMLEKKYGMKPPPFQKPQSPVQMEMKAALAKYGAAFAKLVNDLNSKEAVKHGSVVMKKATDRSMENAMRLICVGLPAREAATIAIVNPMAPVSDELVTKFFTAAKQVVDSCII